MCFPSLVTFTGTSSLCASLSSGSLFLASSGHLPFHCSGDCATFVSGVVFCVSVCICSGVSSGFVRAVGTHSRCSPCSGASSDVLVPLQEALSCPHQLRRSWQPWGSPEGIRHIVEGQNNLSFHVFHPLPSSNSCDGASPTGAPLQPE